MLRRNAATPRKMAGVISGLHRDLVELGGELPVRALIARARRRRARRRARAARRAGPITSRSDGARGEGRGPRC